MNAHPSRLCSVYQRYILKAIHNPILEKVNINGVVFGISKIHFESNSQRYNYTTSITLSCVRYIKDTFWKQFTTAGKEQENRVSCVRYIKDTFWKQFTTNFKVLREVISCVRYIKDTFWKQFTTDLGTVCQNGELFAVFQRYILRAIHNIFDVVYW